MTSVPTSLSPKAYICQDCGARVEEDDVLTAANPFCADELIDACPECRSPESLTRACSMEGCVNKAELGRRERGADRLVLLCRKHAGGAS